MKTSKYLESIEGLAASYRNAVAVPAKDVLDLARAAIAGRMLVAIGSGGALASAEAAAVLYRALSGREARATTPLAYIEQGAISGQAVMLFSARAKHPDTAFAVEHALAKGDPVVLITERRREDFEGTLAGSGVIIVTVPPSPSDGFLATQSVLTMATVAARIISNDTGIPENLEIPALKGGPLRTRLLVLHSTNGRAAAVDVETRFNELGLADVQVADYRNFAHGRHVGLSRRMDHTTVIALKTAASSALAERTIAALPATATVVELASTATDEISSVLGLLAGAMSLPSELAIKQGLNPAKPPVPEFGRRLYHLPYRRSLPVKRLGPVERKLSSAALSTSDSAGPLYADAYSRWKDKLRAERFAAILLDYDGTVVSTADRFELPSPTVREQLLRLLEANIPLVFSTGRGDSLYADLRRWVPRSRWSQINLGLHNGSWFQPLSEPLCEEESVPAVVAAADELDPFVRSGVLQTRVGPSQLTVSPLDRGMSVASIAKIVESTVSRIPGVKVQASGHSVDVIASSAGKEDTLAWSVATFGATLAVGDQGDYGGNDFALLHAQELTVTVDVCSPSLSRCWNISPPGTRGPEALSRVLRLLKPGKLGARIQQTSSM